MRPRKKKGKRRKRHVRSVDLFGAGVFGDSLGTLRDGVLGKFTGKNETDSSLNFTRRDGRTLVVSSKLGSFGGNAFKDVIDEGVQDRHGLVGDTSVGVDLLQDTVNVGGVGFLASDLSLLVTLDLLLGGLGGSLAGSGFVSLGSH